MNDRTRTGELFSHIERNLGVLAELREELRLAVEQDVKKLGRTQRAAIMVAGIIESYYTCIETVFLRISQFFENSLRPERWHHDLLERMNLEIADVRPRVISDEVYSDLVELMRFRHFRRYYFSLAYDWERLDAVLDRLSRTHPVLCEELEAFHSLIEKL